MRRSAGRIVAILAIVAVAVFLVMSTGGGDDYKVTAEFQNASQLVTGNEVLVGGLAAGSVKEIELGEDGVALVTMTVDEDFAPLTRGTTATVRLGSLSSVAGRQVQLTLPPAGSEGEEIEDGGTLSQAETVSAVDLDEIFNTLDTETVKDFKDVITGFRDSYEAEPGACARESKGSNECFADAANEGSKYFNPLLSTSRRVFSQLTQSPAAFEGLLVDAASLSDLLAERRDDLSLLVLNASDALGAIGRQRTALADAINQLPSFMRQANTTFVNLRAALDDVDPLVAASIPVARRLGPFFREFRAAAADAVPTIRDLDQIVSQPGKANDLIELTRLQVPLAEAGVGSGAPDCGDDPTTDFAAAQDEDFTQGGLGEATCALINGNVQLTQIRANVPELVGWFDGFSTSGLVDASGPLGRINTTFNAFSLGTNGLPNVFSNLLGGLIDPTDVLGLDPPGPAPPANPLIDAGNNSRCPSALERDPGDGSTPFEPAGVACDETQVPTGP